MGATQYGLYKRIFTAQSADTTQLLDTKDFTSCVVTITGNGTPDGTVNVYTVPNPVDAPTKTVLDVTYPTPTTTKQFVGFMNGGLLFELTGNTTDSVDVEVVLK